MKHFFSKLLFPKFYVPLALIIVAGGWFAYSSFTDKPTAESIIVTRGTIAQEVIVTGKTESVSSANLAFERSGRINRAYVKVGDIVNAGQILAELDQAAVYADYLEAQGNLESQQAKLDELTKGTRPEELKISQAKADSARASLEDAKRGVVDKLQDAYTKSDDAVHNAVDQLFSNPLSTSPKVNIVGFPQKEEAEKQRFLIEPILTAWGPAVSGLTISQDLSTAITTGKDNLSKTKVFLELIASSVNGLTANSSLTQTIIDGYKSDISTARTNLNTATTNLTTASEKLTTAQSNLEIAENELSLSLAGSTPEAIKAQTALVTQARAKLQGIQAQLAQMAIRSPLRGTITKQDAKAGEIATANAIVISVIATDNIQIKANIPEVDIGRVSIGNPVEITLDAFPGEKFGGKVMYIDPGETIVDGVVNFQVTIQFDSSDPRVKSGLTSNLSIRTIEKRDVLIVPQYAILENDQGTYVRMERNGKLEDIPVVIGIRSIDGMVEIISGISAGDRLVNIGIKATNE